MKEFEGKTKAELQTMTKDARIKLQGLRFDLASGKLKNVKEIKETKKRIAQLLTICQKEN